MANSMMSWFKAHLPTRDTIAANKWTRPFAKYLLRPDLWRFNRRSVPRAVAVGLFIAPVIPIAHTFVAALLAVPARANIVVAAAVTWLINPFTMAPFYYAAYKIGYFLLNMDSANVAPNVTHEAAHQATSWLSWLYAASGPVALGTFVMAAVIAAVGYLLTSIGWTWWSARKWRARKLRTKAIIKVVD
jgi:uncharacterized protein